MGKTTYVLLIALVTLIMVLVGGNQQMAISGRDIVASIPSIESSPQGIAQEFNNLNPGGSGKSGLCYIGLVHSGSGAINPCNSPLSNSLTTSFLLDHSQQPYCSRLIDNDGEGLNLNQASPGTRTCGAVNCNVHGHNSPAESMREAFSNNLLESYPPGYFLLI